MMNVDQARHFLELLGDDADKEYHWQVFYDRKDVKKPAQEFYATLNDSIEYFKAVQAQHYGVYVCINETDGKGREEENIIGYRTLFADIDGMVIPDFPIEPTFLTQRDDTHAHAFWRVPNILTAEQFRNLQKRISIYLNSDGQVTDPTRVARLPGSTHYKDINNPAQYEVTRTGGEHYTIEQITEAFELTGEKLEELNKWCGGRDSLNDGAGFNDLVVYQHKFISWLERAEPAVEGNGGTYTVIKVASMGYDLGVPLDVAQDLMWEYYDQRCVPTWHSTDDRIHFNKVVARAYKYANNAPGCRTACSLFDTVIEPPCGWEENAKLGVKSDRTTTPTIEWSEPVAKEDQCDDEVETAALMAQITNKSATWDMGRGFIGRKFSGKKLIRSDSMFFEFNGKCWKEISDDNIRSQAAWFYQHLKLAPSKINNIHSSVCNYVYQSELENNIWLNEEYPNDETVVFNNCISIIGDNETITLPHTRDFFTMNDLKHDYNPNAKCPEWLKFLDSIWDDNTMLKEQLQMLFGYVLSSSTKHEILPIFVGKSRGGKGVITGVLSNMIGAHNTVSPSLDSIVKDFMLLSMSKAKLALIPEATSIHPSKRGEVLGNLKALTGNDSITYDRKFQTADSNDRWCKVIISTNDMPEFVDNSGALANRVLPFPFTKTFKGREDTNLKTRLATEMSGIVNWAIEGLRMLNAKGGFTMAEESREMVEDMRRDMFPLADFVEEFCTLDPTAETETAELHTAYLVYCKRHDVRMPMNSNKFGRCLKSCYLPINHKRLTINGKRPQGFTGVRVNLEALKPSGNVVSANFGAAPAIPTIPAAPVLKV